MIAVVDYIGEIVQKTSDRLSQVISSGVSYRFGTAIEFSSRLSGISGAMGFKEQNYPAIFLLQDFVEKMGVDADTETQVKLQLLIVAGSDQNYCAADRYERVFKPVLYPIYETFIKILNKDSRLNIPYSGASHEKIDRPLMAGSLEETTKGKVDLFSEQLDAIEIRDLLITFLKIC
jgi:hypothetical protein